MKYIKLKDLIKFTKNKSRALFVYDPDSKTFKAVESICFNGKTLQLNVEQWKGRKS